MKPNEHLEHAIDRRMMLRLGAMAGLGAAAMPRLAWASAQPDLAPNLRAMVARWVDSGQVPGLVASLGLPGRPTEFIVRGAEGFTDADPMSADSIFRIYSMTKPITGMAAMMLIDEGKLGLDQPVADFIPAYADMQVQVTPDGSITDLRPAQTQITIRHLLTHTAGLAYSIIQKGPILAMMIERGLLPGRVTKLPIPMLGLGPNPRVESLAAFAEGMAEVPLVYEPGTKYSYSVSLDVLGRVIEIASGQPFDVFLQEKFFDPLGMASTGFVVRRNDAHRLVTNYAVLDSKLLPIDGPDDSIYLDQPEFPFGGAGLVSTPRDYDRFLAMLAGRGALDGVRVMSEAAVRMGTGNLLPDGVEGKTGFGNVSHYGAGGRVGIGDEAGVFGWAGAAATVGMVDMIHGLRSQIYAQFMPPDALDLLPEFQTALREDIRALMARA